MNSDEVKEFVRKLGYISLEQLIEVAKDSGYNNLRDYLKDNLVVDQVKTMTEEEIEKVFDIRKSNHHDSETKDSIAS